MRPPRPGRHGAGDRVQRRSGRPGAQPSRAAASPGCTSSISTAPSPAGRSTPRRSRPSWRGIQIPVQLGGGIRDMATIEGWLARGVAPRHHRHRRGARSRARARGRARLPRPDRRRHRRPGRPRRGRGLGRGFGRHGASTLARRFEDAGVAAIIYTDIARDGVLKGLNIEATLALAAAISIPVIASGGLASLDDVRRLLAAGLRRHRRARSPAARSMTAGSIRRRRWR